MGKIIKKKKRMKFVIALMTAGVMAAAPDFETMSDEDKKKMFDEMKKALEAGNECTKNEDCKDKGDKNLCMLADIKVAQISADSLTVAKCVTKEEGDAAIAEGTKKEEQAGLTMEVTAKWAGASKFGLAAASLLALSAYM